MRYQSANLEKVDRRYQQAGPDDLRSTSRRPLSSPAQKVTSEHEVWILQIRRRRNLGARRIHSELQRPHECRLSLATIHKVLKRHQVKPMMRKRGGRIVMRYSRPIPGELVQMDVRKNAPGLYQFTTIDDSTRYRVLGLYPRDVPPSTHAKS